MLTRVSLAVDKPRLRGRLREALNLPDVLLEPLSGKSRLWERLARTTADVVVLSQSLVPKPEHELIGFLCALPDAPTVVVLSPTENPKQHARLVAAGCDAVLYEGLPTDSFREVFDTVLQKRALMAQRAVEAGLDMERATLSDFVSQSPAMQDFMQVVHRVVPTDVPLLILGETGVGKERLARAVHAEGSRAGGPFIPVNCGSLPESLLESELFGHEKGAFTGASRSRRGWFELAHKGTVFLDEIGEMPYHLQVKLLRVLQDHLVQPIGAEEPLTVDVRVMAASNRDLEAEVEQGNFRRDLYYRLSVVTLTVPPLRDRREDISVLVDSYLSYLQPRIGCRVEGITRQATRCLGEYFWPGNVRELINIIERAMLLCDGGRITVADLPQVIRGGRVGPHGSRAAGPPRGALALPVGDWTERPWSDVRSEALTQVEHAYFAGLLRATGGRVGVTADRAGIQPRSLYEKMQRHGLRKEDFRD
jgi:two-component system response regulator AtoC